MSEKYEVIVDMTNRGALYRRSEKNGRYESFEILLRRFLRENDLRLTGCVFRDTREAQRRHSFSFVDSFALSKREDFETFSRAIRAIGGREIRDVSILDNPVDRFTLRLNANPRNPSKSSKSKSHKRNGKEVRR